MKILLVDDHTLIREGLRMVLRGFDEVVECVEAADGGSAQRCLEEHPEIDLVLLDRRLPDCDGIDLLQRLLTRRPELPVVLLSADFDAGIVARSIEAGAAGFIPKTSVTTVLLSALRLILAGGVYVPPEALRRPGHSDTPHAEPPPPPASPPAQVTAGEQGAPSGEPVTEPGGRAATDGAGLGLTERQIDVLALLMEGRSNKQIGRELDLAEATVKVHVRSIMRTLDANSRTEAVVNASRRGLRFEMPRRER